MKKIIALALSCMLVVTLFAGCGSTDGTTASPDGGTSANAEGNITASGSTALQPLLELAVEPFKASTGFTGSITINGGGSGTGLTDVTAGTVNIGNSDVTPEQAGKDGTGLVDHTVAVVAVGIAVSSDVAASITSISTADLVGIFNGTITDWNQVTGWTGESLPISVFYRKAGSGTRTLFETYGTGTKLSDAEIGAFVNFTKKESSGDLESAIATGKGAIGYDSLPYCADLSLLELDGVAATYENVYSGKYAIWGYEHMFTLGEATGSVKSFIDYVMSADFEKTITDSGYGVASKMTVSR